MVFGRMEQTSVIRSPIDCLSPGRAFLLAFSGALVTSQSCNVLKLSAVAHYYLLTQAAGLFELEAHTFDPWDSAAEVQSFVVGYLMMAHGSASANTNPVG